MTQIMMKEESSPAAVPALMCTTPTLSPRIPATSPVLTLSTFMSRRKSLGACLRLTPFSMCFTVSSRGGLLSLVWAWALNETRRSGDDRIGAYELALVAATHRQHAAGDVARLVRGQEQDRRRHLVQGAVALHQTALLGLVDVRLEPGLLGLVAGLRSAAGNLPRRRLGAPDPGGRHADAVLSILEGQGLGQRIDAALGRRVGDPVDAASRHRGDVDDDATALLHQGGQHGATAPQGRHQRAGHLDGDLALAELGERLEVDRPAHVVDQDIDAAEEIGR